jgi:tellurite resistance protein TerC
MIAGASWAWWIGFHAVVAALLVTEALVAGRRGAGGRFAWVSALVLLLCTIAFGCWIGQVHGRQAALEFAAGYAIEISLSIDNLFVFMVLFAGFEITPERQRRALLWGICGAIVLRALFVAAGITLLRRFNWITWLLGLFLLYVAFRLARGRSARDVIPGWVRKLQPARGSLLPVIVAVEVTDILFATDSIPAVLAVTHNPFVAYTSNIAAVLGLRSLYGGLAKMLDRFRYLHYGLAAMLAFVGLKMLAERWITVPITVSLMVIGAILLACAAGGLRKKPSQPERRSLEL